MKIGLVGKPNVGKSTLFAALTSVPAEIADYPFTTIDPNIGIALVELPMPCPCLELSNDSSLAKQRNSSCTPRTGTCKKGIRSVPIQLVDVAGLVPGAHSGKGRGNQFLNDLSRCDLLIQVVDISGSTDLEGNSGFDVNTYSGKQEVMFLDEELTLWICDILSHQWSRTARKAQGKGRQGVILCIAERLSGLGINKKLINSVLNQVKFNLDMNNPWDWSSETMYKLSKLIREISFPTIIAANKIDKLEKGGFEGALSLFGESDQPLFPISADTELALKRIISSGLANFDSRDNKLNISDSKNLDNKHIRGIQAIQSRLNVIEKTGVSDLLQYSVFNKLKKIVAYPVFDDSKWTDVEGNILPDALLLSPNSTARDLAYAVHSDLGDGFVKATNARNGRGLGSDYEIQSGDVIRIYAKT